MGYAVKDTVLVASFVGGLFFGVAALFLPGSVGGVLPTWSVTNKHVLPVVCDHPDLGASTGNFSACVDLLMQRG